MELQYRQAGFAPETSDKALKGPGQGIAEIAGLRWPLPFTRFNDSLGAGTSAMFKLIALTISIALCQPAAAWAQDLARAPDDATQREILDDAAIAALIIAGSVAMYKAMGRPCACPADQTRNGQRCGGRSAWSKAGGARPLCFPSDVTPDMISAYRVSKAVPPLW